MSKHILYTNEDINAPDSIKDQYGDVVLSLCKKCGRGESELDLNGGICPWNKNAFDSIVKKAKAQITALDEDPWWSI